MGIKITDMTAGGTADGTEIIPTSKAGAPRSVTTANIYAYIKAALEAITAGVSVATGNKLLALQSGLIKPVDIDLVTQRAIDIIWGKASATPASGDTLAFKTSGGVEKTTTVTLLAGVVRGIVEAAILDVSDLSDGSGTLATTDYMLVTQGTTGKRITVQDLYDAIYDGLAAHVDGLTALADTGDDADLLYVVRSGVGKKLTFANFASYIADQATLSGTGTTGALTKWAGTNELTDGPTIAEAASGFTTGNDTTIPTTGAVRKELNEVVNDATDIGAALTDDDDILVYDDSAADQKKAALSRIKTYARDTIVTDATALSAGTLAGTDRILIYDDSATAQRKALMTDVKTYLETAGVYKTIWVPAKDMTASTTSPAEATTYEFAGQDMTHTVLNFAGAAADEFAEFDLVMPESWDRGTIKYKVYWTNGHADANPDEWVEFYLSAGARSNDDAMDAALGTAISVLDQHIADDDMHVTDASASLTVGGTPALGDMIHFKLGRDYDEANGGTAMDVDARVFGVLIQYRENLEVAAW